MTLDELLLDIAGAQHIENSRGTVVSGIFCDSRQVTPQSVFVAVQGATANGERFVQDALGKGACCAVVQRGSNTGGPLGKTIEVEDVFQAFVLLLQRFYRLPSDDMLLTGITGTNGKTTITYLLESIFCGAGKACGVIGTVNYRFHDHIVASKNTTPGLADNYRILRSMADAKVQACVMEVSSHALVQRRVAGLRFADAVFTNLTSDHLDYHHTQEEYFQAKAKFFDGSVNIEHAVINVDDPFGKRIVDLCPFPRMTYGFDQDADLSVLSCDIGLDGTRFLLRGPFGEAEFRTRLIGRHNVSNIMSAVAVAYHQGLDLKDIQKGVLALDLVPGRLERIENGHGLHVFVDYAHTEDALWNVLSNLKGLTSSRIITVFGCGGDRDRTKRPKMARVVGELSDWAIVTNDNPRSEDPKVIAEEVVLGFSRDRYEVILDRVEAIGQAFKMASAGDVVLIAGKGHEDYQIFKDRTIHFDDREVARQILSQGRQG